MLSVLIVEDEAMIRENLTAYLEDEGMRVVAVESAEEAIIEVQQGRCFAVCIMDIRLPGMDGNAGIRILHTLCPSLKFVIHTGSSDYSLPSDLQTIGMRESDVYHKPLDTMELLAQAVRALVKSTRDSE